MPAPSCEVSNRFGSVRIEPVTDFMPIGQITSKDPAAEANGFDLTTAEQIALITENRGIQICFPFPHTNQAFLVMHDSPTSAAICRVSVVEFTSEEVPADILESINSRPSTAAIVGMESSL